MTPGKALLQKPMDPAQATLANGVKCGSALIEWSSGYADGEPGWSGKCTARLRNRRHDRLVPELAKRDSGTHILDD